jgi:DNA-binding response OmpR family regulator
MIEETRKANILAVDDNPANLRLLVEILQEQGYLVRPVPSGKFALTAAQGLPPDLILLDIMMPELDGYEVCQCLKNEEKTRHIPVIFISALNDALDKVKAFSVGGVDYITKPFQVEEILARVATHLRLSSLQQNLVQKTQALTETLQALQITQNQLIQTEKMAALGQLIAGIAHEINTPMGAIRSSIENITDFFDQYLLELPEIFSDLSVEERHLLRNILSLTQENSHNLSTREKRQIKRNIIQYLQAETIADSEVIADSLVDLGILEISQVSTILPYFKTSQGLELLHFADKIYSLKRSSKTIVSATEKASKIVFALKNYVTVQGVS